MIIYKNGINVGSDKDEKVTPRDYKELIDFLNFTCTHTTNYPPTRIVYHFESKEQTERVVGIIKEKKVYSIYGHIYFNHN